jgi:uncharacterized protein with NRDE domain
VCLAVVALDAHPRFALVVAANRDEYHARAATSAAWWPDVDPPMLAGRDLRAGGTWLGIDARGRFAFVTNVREPGRHDPDAPSRGALVPQVLADPRDVQTAVVDAVRESARRNGFNLIAGDARGAAWGSNRGAGTRSLAPGFHGVSNAELDTPWPKVVRARRALERWCADDATDVERLFAMLADRRTASDDELPATGVTLEMERMLSPPFIMSELYGTRCSTVITIGRDGNVRFIERSFDADGGRAGQVEFEFAATG